MSQMPNLLANPLPEPPQQQAGTGYMPPESPQGGEGQAPPIPLDQFVQQRNADVPEELTKPPVEQQEPSPPEPQPPAQPQWLKILNARGQDIGAPMYDAQGQRVGTQSRPLPQAPSMPEAITPQQLQQIYQMVDRATPQVGNNPHQQLARLQQVHHTVNQMVSHEHARRQSQTREKGLEARLLEREGQHTKAFAAQKEFWQNKFDQQKEFSQDKFDRQQDAVKAKREGVQNENQLIGSIEGELRRRVEHAHGEIAKADKPEKAPQHYRDFVAKFGDEDSFNQEVMRRVALRKSQLGMPSKPAGLPDGPLAPGVAPGHGTSAADPAAVKEQVDALQKLHEQQGNPEKKELTPEEAARPSKLPMDRLKEVHDLGSKTIAGMPGIHQMGAVFPSSPLYHLNDMMDILGKARNEGRTLTNGELIRYHKAHAKLPASDVTPLLKLKQ